MWEIFVHKNERVSGDKMNDVKISEETSWLESEADLENRSGDIQSSKYHQSELVSQVEVGVTLGTMGLY